MPSCRSAGGTIARALRRPRTVGASAWVGLGLAAVPTPPWGGVPRTNVRCSGGHHEGLLSAPRVLRVWLNHPGPLVLATQQIRERPQGAGWTVGAAVGAQFCLAPKPGALTTGISQPSDGSSGLGGWARLTSHPACPGHFHTGPRPLPSRPGAPTPVTLPRLFTGPPGRAPYPAACPN